ncbi:MAG: class I SAM-dependent methyltransferase [Coleofasciculus chthonoplastes F3-SA18-01]|uniref:class I SAM-dependent methyltransferase n=1 Tax=Coleofasciculus chthonoplastes TaxID=64178 RepID=UPI0032F6831E
MKNYEELNIAQEVSETDPFTRERYKQFYCNFPKHVQTVIDIGCNTGRGGEILKELNPNLKLVGLDCVASRLAKISPDIYVSTICSYSSNIESPDSSFDIVVAGEFIEHIYPDEVIRTLQEFYRIIKPAGRLLLTTPNPNYLRLKLTGGSVLGGAHVSQHYPAELKQQLESVGFVNVKLIGSGKMTRILGERLPILAFYGSYLTIADR